MVTATIKEMAERRGITSSYQLMKLLNVPPSQALKWFSNDLESVSFRTLNRLCEVLQCQPGDLLVYIPDGAEAETAKRKTGKAKKGARAK